MNKVFGAIICVFLGYVIFATLKVLYKVPLRPNAADESPWWGPGESRNEKLVIKEFSVNISDQVIEDLKQRLENVKTFQPPLEGKQQQYGFNTNNLKSILNFWLKEYNWPERQKLLNKFPQYTVNIQGLRIHYIHVKPKRIDGVKVVPLLLMHGWPSSTREMFDLIPLLTTQQKGQKIVFEVIAPNLPGFGFSEGTTKPGLNPMQIAIIMKNLMKALGYEKYYIQGGDWGGHIGHLIAILFPENLLGFHSNFCYISTPLGLLKTFIGGFFPSLVIDDKCIDKVYPMKEKIQYLFKEGGYMHIQATKPDSLGVALSDSPIGLASYLLEKFSQFTNPKNEFLEDGGLKKYFKLEDLLDNIMIYWVTGSITTSMRIYAENFAKDYYSLHVGSIPTNVPTACARFSNELIYPIEWVLRDHFTNLVQVNDLEGGHFAHLEVPHTLAEDLYKFVAKVERSFYSED